MSGFTKGPWEVGRHPAMAKGWIVRPVFFGSRVTILPECEGGHVALQSEPDARLIASAPDMFEALENIVKCMDANFGRQNEKLADITQMARAALSKATGSQGVE